MGGDIRLRAEGFFAFEDLGFRKLKGKAEPIPVFKVLRAKTGSGVIRFDRRMAAEMVGRDKELDKLESQVLRAIDGEGSVVNIVGEPGIGKSRLIAELKKREVMKRVTLLEGRAISMGKNLSFHPITDLLKKWAGIADRDSEAAAFDRLEKAVRAIHPEEAHEILPFLATLMGMKLSGKHADRVRDISGEPLEKLVLKNVRDLLTRATQVIPVVIVMEDLHWADASSLLLLNYLYHLALTQKIVFFNLFRPGYWHAEDGSVELLKARAPALRVVEIPIQPLDPQSSGALIDNILNIGGLELRVKGPIIERAGGNPYFIEELVRSLIDQGAVKPGDSGFAVTDKIHSVVIPPTISEVLMARIDRLDEECRNVIKLASVIGRSFFDRVIKDVADSTADMDDRLSFLEELQLILSRMRMEELEYLFKHSLVQEVAYESILLSRRKKLHLRVAQTIERIFRERLHEFYGMLAYHYGKAEIPEKTEEYLIKAGEEALKSAASNEALHYYQEALIIYRRLRGTDVDPEKVAILEKNIGNALFTRGHYTESVEHFDEALNYYWGELPKNAFSQAVRFLSSFLTFLLALYLPSRWFKKIPAQRDAEAVDLFFKKALALSVIDPKRFFIEFFFYQATFVHFDLTKFKMGVGIFAGANALFSFTGLSFNIGRRILDYAKPRLAEDNTKQCIGYDQLDTMTLFLQGQWHEITELDPELVERALKTGEMWDAGMNYYWHGLPKIYQSHFDTARSMVTRLSDIAEVYDNEGCRLLKNLLNSHLLIECRHLAEAITEVDRGMGSVRRQGGALSILHMHSLRAWILLLMDKTEEARKALEQASQVRRGIRVPPIQLSIFLRSEFQYYLSCSEEAFRGSQKTEASEYGKKALKTGKMLIRTCRKAALCRTDSYRLMGSCNWLIHDQRSAVKWWQKAIEEGEGLGARSQVARTYAEMAMRFAAMDGEFSKPDLERAKEPLEKARAMFRDLGLHHDLEALNSVFPE